MGSLGHAQGRAGCEHGPAGNKDLGKITSAEESGEVPRSLWWHDRVRVPGCPLAPWTLWHGVLLTP
eukprot:4016499-Amphidinium_carterae.1